MEENKKNLSFVERMKQKTRQQSKYGGDFEDKQAAVDTRDCPNCGAGRAREEGVTRCAYCGFEFQQNQITGGIHLSEKDNSAS